MSSSKELLSKPSKRARPMPSFVVSSRSASWNRECAEGLLFTVNGPFPTSSRSSRSFYPPLFQTAPVPSNGKDTTAPATTPRPSPGKKHRTYAVKGDGISGMSRFTSSYGICDLCGKRTTKAGMSRHLQSCLAEHEPSRGEAARIFRLRIEDAYSPVYWMDVEMKARSTLEELDDFLRGE